MNFENMWSIHHNHSDIMYVSFYTHDLIRSNLPSDSFWAIALPLMAVVVPMFMWPDFKRMWQYAKKRILAQKTKKVGSATYVVVTRLTLLTNDLKRE